MESPQKSIFNLAALNPDPAEPVYALSLQIV